VTASLNKSEINKWALSKGNLELTTRAAFDLWVVVQAVLLRMNKR
jgi:hypothetical protein